MYTTLRTYNILLIYLIHISQCTIHKTTHDKTTGRTHHVQCLTIFQSTVRIMITYEGLKAEFFDAIEVTRLKSVSHCYDDSFFFFYHQNFRKM